MIAEDNVTGMTSNPTIFQKAIAEGEAYDAQIRELLASGVDDPNDIFLELAIPTSAPPPTSCGRSTSAPTARTASSASRCRPTPPTDTARSIDLALDYWKRVDRPNLMVKIPATPEGVPAIRNALTAGVNINVTLVFALSAYDDVIHAYLDALGARVAAGQSPDVHSVGSFFVSRVDTAVDKLLEEKLAADPGNAVIEDLFGKAAIANARLAYEKFESYFRGEPVRQARRRGCARAASAVGEHQRQESQVPRRRVRRGAHRPRHRRHHATGDHRGLPRPRCRRRGDGQGGHRRGASRHGAAGRGRHRHGQGDLRPARRRRQVVHQLVQRADPRHRREGRTRCTVATVRACASTWRASTRFGARRGRRPQHCGGGPAHLGS